MNKTFTKPLSSNKKKKLLEDKELSRGYYKIVSKQYRKTKLVRVEAKLHAALKHLAKKDHMTLSKFISALLLSLIPKGLIQYATAQEAERQLEVSEKIKQTFLK